MSYNKGVEERTEELEEILEHSRKICRAIKEYLNAEDDEFTYGNVDSRYLGWGVQYTISIQPPNVDSVVRIEGAILIKETRVGKYQVSWMVGDDRVANNDEVSPGRLDNDINPNTTTWTDFFSEGSQGLKEKIREQARTTAEDKMVRILSPNQEG